MSTTPSSSSPSTTSTSSSSSSSTTTSASSESALFGFLIGSAPDTVFMTAGSTATFPILTFTLLPTAASGSETATLSSTAPAGMALTFYTNSVKLSTGTVHALGTPDFSDQMTVNSSQSVAPGAYKITIVAKYGASSATCDLTVNVVKYLITIPNNVNEFIPQNLTVKQGSTVFWFNQDADNPYDVVFTSGSSAQSGAIVPFGWYSYTFSSTGTYSYFSTVNKFMTGTITVTPNG